MKHFRDAQRRYEMVCAERSMYKEESKFYKQLDEIAKFIFSEYTAGKRGNTTRHFFRMDKNGYHLTILNDSERF